MSKTYGVAKKATAIAVKIFGSDGSTTTLYVNARANQVDSTTMHYYRCVI